MKHVFQVVRNRRPYGQYQGELFSPYCKLVERLGQPVMATDGKADVEWVVVFDGQTVGSIYNYKDGVAYLGSNGLPTTAIRRWHIGGESINIVEMFAYILDQPVRALGGPPHVGGGGKPGRL